MNILDRRTEADMRIVHEELEDDEMMLDELNQRLSVAAAAVARRKNPLSLALLHFDYKKRVEWNGVKRSEGIYPAL
ncbi:hypothetical protein CHUAL_007153 [Chamberlinius hualienensis]